MEHSNVGPGNNLCIKRLVKRNEVLGREYLQHRLITIRGFIWKGGGGT